jgi:cyanophycinase
MSRHLLHLSLLALVLGASACASSTSLSLGPVAESSRPAPPKGWLLIVGGGGTTDDMYARAISLGGGAGSKVVIFPQASELPDTGESSAAVWRGNGAGEVRVADTKQEAAALELVKWATIIWFPGGVQARLMDALGTELPAAIKLRYQDGAVVGGTSAGAAVMSSVMITGEIEGEDGDDGGLTFVRSQTVETKRGLGLVDWAVVDQHFVRRRRFNRLLSCVLDNPRLVGIGIDERTAVLVHDDAFEVLGESNVLVIDARDSRDVEGKKGLRPSATGLHVSLLAHGMRFEAAK